MQKGGLAIVLFNQELRVHDNQLLAECLSLGQPVLPIFCFEDSRFSLVPKGEPYRIWNASNCSAIRLKFYLEAVEELQESLRQINLDLLVSQKSWREVLTEVLTSGDEECTVLFREDF